MEGAEVIVVQPARIGINHGFHALMTILTCGCWFPIWVLFCFLDVAANG